MTQRETNRRRTVWTKCRNPVFYVPVAACVLLLYVLDLRQLDVYSVKLRPPKFDVDSGFVIRTSGCRIPFLDPLDASVRKFISKVKPLRCGDAPLVTADATALHVHLDKLPLYNFTNTTLLDCCYQPFWRAEPHVDASDNVVNFGDCIRFQSYAQMEYEFVKVVCKVNDTEIYRDFHSFVPRKTVSVDKSEPPSAAVNVLVLGLDSVSRLNFERQLPRTRRFLLERLNAIEMLGYNKVGDNTFPNLMPILTGLSVDEMQRTCWPDTHDKFDNCSFIWTNFSRAGYLTAYAEDSSWMGVFNYVKRGFQKQPTHYYWRTFNYIAEKEIGHNKPYNADLCLGPRPVYMVLLDYVLKFVNTLTVDRYFGFFWGTSLSHDNLNYPALGDDGYVSFFEALDASDILNRTVLIFLSDHGMRWGDIRSTHQGHLEERLPFLFIRLPIWFTQKYAAAAANLRRNARRLTSPFDLHETLLDLVQTERLEADALRLNIGARGVSLFTAIPENRTCTSAGISSHWCTCQRSVEVERNSSVVVRAAAFVVASVNALLAGHMECASLLLDGIVDARLLQSQDYLNNNSSIRDYTLIVRTVPGNALFEATIRCIRCDDREPFQLTGTVSRLNLYGAQSACMTNYHLKLYCYCRN